MSILTAPTCAVGKEVIMAFSVLPTQLSPIAIDIGTSSLKVLQVVLGDTPSIHATAEIEIVRPPTSLDGGALQ